MKVFFAETFDDGTVGGSHACMYNLVKHMLGGPFEFTIGSAADNLYVERYRELGLPVMLLPERRPIRGGNPVLRKLRNWYRLERALQKHLEATFRRHGFDLVVLNNSVFVSLPYIRACRALGIPVVVYERGLGYFLPRHVRASAHIDVAIPVSEAVLGFLHEYDYRAREIRVIYDGIDPAGFGREASPQDVKRDLGIPESARLVGILGNLKPWKGQAVFVDAMARLASDHPDLHGLIIGGTSDEDREFERGLRARVQEIGLADHVHFLGYRTDARRLLGALDVFVHASRKPEPFGMVLLEAMATSLPVVATAIGGPLEIVGTDGRYGRLVPPDDPAAMATACAGFLGDRKLAERTAESARGRVLDTFHIERTVRETGELFERLCAAEAGAEGKR